MAKAEGGKLKPTGTRKPASKDKKAQAERFIETARLLCADETGKKFEQSFDRLVRQRINIMDD